MALATQAVLAQQEPADGEVSPKVALEAKFVRAESLFQRGRKDEALAMMRQIANEAARKRIALSPQVEKMLRRYLSGAPAEASAEPGKGVDRIEKILQAERERLALQRTASRTKARGLYERAQALYKRQRLAEAEALLQQALQAWPEYADAQRLLNTVRDRLQVASPEVEDAYGQLGQIRRVQVERQVARIERLIEDAGEDIDATNYPLALAKLEMAMDKARFGNLPASLQKKYTRQLREKIRLTQQAQAEYNQELRRRQMREALIEEEQRQRRIEEAEAQRLGRMLAELDRQMKLEAYPRAMELADAVLQEEALTLEQRDRVKTIRAAARSLKNLRDLEYFRNESKYQTGMRYNEMEEQIVPWHGIDDLRTYPDNWQELSRQRREQVRQQFVTDEDTPSALVRQKMQQPIDLPGFQAETTKLSDVIRLFKERLNVNVQEKYDPNMPVTIDRMQNLRADVALDAILNAADPDLGWAIRDGLLVIGDSEDEAITGGKQVAVIDIHDLVYDIPDFTDTPDFSIRNQGSSAYGDDDDDDTGFGGFGDDDDDDDFGGFGDFGDDDDDDDDGDWQPRTSQEITEDLVEQIRQLIDPGNWDTEGRALEATQGKLIVVNTPENIEAVQELLKQIRQAKDVMVNVDFRVVTATKTFMEFIGLDIVDFIASMWGGPQAPLPGEYPNPNINRGAIPASFGNRRGPLGGNLHLQGSVLNTLTTNTGGAGANQLAGINAITPPSGFQPSGLGFTMRYVDDITLGMVIDVTQGSRDVQVLRSPRLTMMNGQVAWIAKDRSLIYTQNTRTIVQQIGTLPGPPPTVIFTTVNQVLLGTLNIGIMFQVRPIVSADRRYVRLHVTPNISTLEDLVPAQIRDIDDTAQAVELPIINNIEIRTGALVPDRGTLVMGGLNTSFTIDMENTVPVLGKLPILGRLLSKRGSSNEKRMTALLIRAEIMLQED
jgi:type II secretory pathway component GspD/PulD (secretin)